MEEFHKNMFSTPPVFDYQFQVLIAGVLTILFLIVLFLDNFLN